MWSSKHHEKMMNTLMCSLCDSIRLVQWSQNDCVRCAIGLAFSSWWTMTESESTISGTINCLCAKFTRSSIKTTAFVRQRRIKLILLQVDICRSSYSAQNDVSLTSLYKLNCMLRVWSLVMYLIKLMSDETLSTQKQGLRQAINFLICWRK